MKKVKLAFAALLSVLFLAVSCDAGKSPSEVVKERELSIARFDFAKANRMTFSNSQQDEKLNESQIEKLFNGFLSGDGILIEDTFNEALLLSGISKLKLSRLYKEAREKDWNSEFVKCRNSKILMPKFIEYMPSIEKKEILKGFDKNDKSCKYFFESLDIKESDFDKAFKKAIDKNVANLDKCKYEEKIDGGETKVTSRCEEYIKVEYILKKRDGEWKIDLGSIERSVEEVLFESLKSNEPSDAEKAKKRAEKPRKKRSDAGGGVEKMSRETSKDDDERGVIRMLKGKQSQENPSLNCAQASTPTEKAICSDAELVRLDKKMVSSYNEKYKMNLLAEGRGYDEQPKWLVKRDKCGSDVKCIKDSYEERLEEIEIEKNMRGW